ncbi:hypothetical protein MKEN_00207000 [Mycena kentingensis (nom. inval.)]|nr:hypothetical protein MKEN_00207000 [Mycena kentingensis (nom. inval.)]
MASLHSLGQPEDLATTFIPPVDGVPNEILVEIFALVPGLPHDVLWLVCRRWRRICTGTPSLWTRIDDKGWHSGRISLAAVYARPGIKSLRLRNIQTAIVEADINLLIALYRHLEQLSLTGTAASLQALFQHAHNADAAQMRSLTVINEPDNDARSADDCEIRLPRMSALVHLVLDHVSMGVSAWLTLRVQNLVRLELHYCAPVHYSLLLHVLRQCHALRDLTLDNVLSVTPPSEGLSTEAAPLDLPNELRRLSISDEPHLLARIQPFLHIPAGANLELSTSDFICDAATIASVAPFVQAKIRNKQAPVLDTIHIDARVGLRFGLSSSSSDGTAFRLTTRCSAVDEDACVSVLFEMLCLPSITCIELKYTRDLSSSFWRSLVDTFPAPITISIGDCDGRGSETLFLKALRDAPQKAALLSVIRLRVAPVAILRPLASAMGSLILLAHQLAGTSSPSLRWFEIVDYPECRGLRGRVSQAVKDATTDMDGIRMDVVYV